MDERFNDSRCTNNDCTQDYLAAAMGFPGTPQAGPRAATTASVAEKASAIATEACSVLQDLTDCVDRLDGNRNRISRQAATNEKQEVSGLTRQTDADLDTIGSFLVRMREEISRLNAAIG